MENKVGFINQKNKPGDPDLDPNPYSNPNPYPNPNPSSNPNPLLNEPHFFFFSDIETSN